jgi:hypothetical protein
MTHRRKFDVQYDLAQFKEDLGLKLDDLPGLFRHYFGEKVGRSTVHYWFSRGSMPRERFIQLLVLARIHCHRRLDVWRYMDVSDPHQPTAQ